MAAFVDGTPSNENVGPTCQVEHRHGTLLERPRVAAVRDGIGLLRSRNGRAQPCVPTIPGSPDLNLTEAILSNAAEGLEVRQGDDGIRRVLRIRRDRFLVVEVVRPIRRVEDPHILPGEAAARKGTPVNADAQVLSGIATDREVRVQERVSVGVGREPGIPAGEDREADRGETQRGIGCAPIGPRRAAIRREPVPRESARGLRCAGRPEGRATEPLGIVPSGDHVKAVIGNGNRRFAPAEEPVRRGFLRRVHPDVRADIARTVAEWGLVPLFRRIQRARDREQLLLPCGTRPRTVGRRRCRERRHGDESDHYDGGDKCKVCFREPPSSRTGAPHGVL